MARLDPEEMDNERGLNGKKQEQKEVKEPQQKVIIYPRCVSIEEMFNSLSDKLDFIISKIQPAE